LLSFIPSAGTTTASSSAESSAIAGKPETVSWWKGIVERGSVKKAVNGKR